SIHCNDFITASQANLTGSRISYHTIGHILVWQIAFAIIHHHSGIYHNGQNHVYRNATNHDNKTLPGWLRAKLPRLRLLLHLLFVHAFIYHPGNFYITAQRQPANAVFGTTYFLFYQRKPRIKKQVEFLYSGFKKLSGNKVPHLMQNDKQGKA